MSLTVWAHALASDPTAKSAPTAVVKMAGEDAGHGAHHNHHGHRHIPDAKAGAVHSHDAAGFHGAQEPLQCGDGVCDKMHCCVGAVFTPRSAVGETRTALGQVAVVAGTTLTSRSLPPDEHPPRR